MKNRLRSLFRSDDFVPTMEVFPSIDTSRIASEMKLMSEGDARGKKDQPSADAQQFDHIETGVIERVEELRRKGLENYETNRRVYNERLARAGQASKEIEIAAGTARNDFGSQVQHSLSQIETSRERLLETFNWRNRFREIHKIEHPIRDFHGWVSLVSLSIIFIVSEAAINSYLFSKGNEFGLLGGMIAAVIVSLVNVGLATFLGFFSRYMNHSKLLKKLLGVASTLVWIFVMVSLNLAVAHFRDSLEIGVEWQQAAKNAIVSFREAPVQLNGIESWLLLALGIFISCIAFWKGTTAEDSYPGYYQVQLALDRARAEYEHALADALDDLEKRRNDAIDDLQEASEDVRHGIGEAIDALFGQSALDNHLETFLEQCELKCSHLIAIYRDANMAARREPAPPSFSKSYAFAKFKPSPIDLSRKADAEKETAKVRKTVDVAIKDIFDRFDEARIEFRTTPEVQATRKEA